MAYNGPALYVEVLPEESQQFVQTAGSGDTKNVWGLKCSKAIRYVAPVSIRAVHNTQQLETPNDVCNGTTLSLRNLPTGRVEQLKPWDYQRHLV